MLLQNQSKTLWKSADFVSFISFEIYALNALYTIIYKSFSAIQVFWGHLGTSETWNSHEGDEKEALSVQGLST